MPTICVTPGAWHIFSQDLLKKCHRCMEVIIDAKERQAAEANKNATILLQEIDLEKVRGNWLRCCMCVRACVRARACTQGVNSALTCMFLTQKHEEDKKAAAARKRAKKKRQKEKKQALKYALDNPVK